MQRISSWTTMVSALGLFRYGTVTGGVAPTPIKAEWLNMVQEELANFILAYVPELDAEDNTQLLQALQAYGATFAVKATTLAGYGITDAYRSTQVDGMLAGKANNAITLAGYGIGDAYTQTAVNDLLALMQAAIDEQLALKQAAINNLASIKQDKNTALMAENGWRLDKATGLLEQWGNGYCGPDSQTGALDFPTPFAEVYNCFGNKVTPNSVDGDANAAGAQAISATQYRLFNDTSGFGATIHWRAIGKAPGY